MLCRAAPGSRHSQCISVLPAGRDPGSAHLSLHMLDIMYEIPKDDNIGEVTITGNYINGTGGPVIDIRTDQVHVKHPAPAPAAEETQAAEEPKKAEEFNFYEF